MADIEWTALRGQIVAGMAGDERDEHVRARAEADAALDVAQLVYDARTTAGLTQTELARAAGTSQAAISAIENAAKVPTVPTLEQIARALGSHLVITFAPTSKESAVA